MNELTIKMRIPSEQHTRLYHMGLVDNTGAPELLGLEGLASVCSGCLYDDMKAFHSATQHAINLYREALPDIVENKASELYQVLRREYAAIGEGMPKPVKLLASDENCLLYYLFSFFENWREYLKDDRLLEE